MRPERQRGFGIIAAIVILVILASLGAFITTLTSSQHIGSALDVQGSRSFLAAQSGLEWGLYHTLKGTPPCPATVSGTGQTTDIGTIGDQYVSVTCYMRADSTIEPGLTAIYQIVATACNVPTSGRCPGDASSANYVERRVTGLVEK
jgi:MSHA biogenesis protein MshP